MTRKHEGQWRNRTTKANPGSLLNRRGPMITPVESEIVMDMLGTCEDSPDLEVETLHVMGAG